MSDRYEDALATAIKYQTQVAHLKLILQPAIEVAKERKKWANSGKLVIRHTPIVDIDKALLEAGRILGVER